MFDVSDFWQRYDHSWSEWWPSPNDLSLKWSADQSPRETLRPGLQVRETCPLFCNITAIYKCRQFSVLHLAVCVQTKSPSKSCTVKLYYNSSLVSDVCYRRIFSVVQCSVRGQRWYVTSCIHLQILLLKHFFLPACRHFNDVSFAFQNAPDALICVKLGSAELLLPHCKTDFQVMQGMDLAELKWIQNDVMSLIMDT